LQRTERVVLVLHAADVRLAVADLVHHDVIDQHEHRAERPALDLATFAEVEDVRPEAADPLAIGLAEVEGIADAAILACRQVIRPSGR
jgi:hypothetical protein